MDVKANHIAILGAIIVVLVGGFLLFNWSVSAAGAEVTFVSGDVELYNADGRWIDALEGDDVETGTRIRTGDGRAIVTFSDGSAFRVDANTEVELLEDSGKTVRLENLDGRVYSRVNPESNLTWEVKALDAEFTALGTAFSVTCDKAHKKVALDVLEHSVAVKLDKEDGKVEKKVLEGKYVAVDLEKPVLEALQQVDLNKEAASVDPFLAWNMEEDEKLKEEVVKEEKAPEEELDPEEFDVLSDADADIEGASEEGSEEEDKKEEVKEEEKKTAPAPVTKAPVSYSGIKLSASTDDKGVKLTWNLTGVSAPHGFKLVKSKSANPTYPNDPATYLSEFERSHYYHLKDGNTYHFRVCTWNGDKGCYAYSNNVTIQAPNKYTSSKTPYEYIDSELQLSAVETDHGVSLNWSACSSPHFTAYKVIRSENNPNPYYPLNPSIKVITDRGSTGHLDFGAVKGKTYYYRICSTESKGPVFCGNVVKLTY